MNVTSSSEALRAYRDASSNNLFSIRHAKRVTTRTDAKTNVICFQKLLTMRFDEKTLHVILYV